MSLKSSEKNLNLYQRFDFLKNFFLILYFFLIFKSSLAFGDASNEALLKIDLSQTDGQNQLVPAMKILTALTILSIAPAILLMTTSFARILIVLSFMRQALGTQTMPPNQVLIGLAMFLTFFTMKPVWTEIQEKAWSPYVSKKISEEEFLSQVIPPIKLFMLHQTRKSDLILFQNISQEKDIDTMSLTTLMPAFLISELKTAFQMGFMVFIPFLIIDMVVSSILMAMGMMMLPPTVVSLPFKLILFVLVDGWSLIVTSVLQSFQNFK